jgi:DNA-binding MarR family transcriptional regulator
LEKENMAERHPDTDDKRLTLIFLIPKGKSTEKEVLFVVNQTLKHAPGALNPKDSNRKETFLQIYNNLETNK